MFYGKLFSTHNIGSTCYQMHHEIQMSKMLLQEYIFINMYTGTVYLLSLGLEMS